MLRIRETRGGVEVLANGERLENVSLLYNDSMLEVHDRKALKTLGECTFKGLNGISVVDLRKFFRLPALDMVSIAAPVEVLKTKKKKNFSIDYYFRTPLRNWKKLYSFGEYTQELLRACEQRSIPNAEFTRCESEGFGDENLLYDEDSLLMEFSIVDPTSKIGPELTRTSQLVSTICVEAIGVLLSRSGDPLTTAFDFPPAIRASCEKYMIHFAEFLNHAGAESTSPDEGEAGRVLFTSPTSSGPEALEKIRDALGLHIRNQKSSSSPDKR